ncbi:Holliday junction resolvase RuvX [Pseudomarimonas salicorniae]|uniref:Putative pre-16S rRNA nuclease n=1 Tax=Pseudomarimonas salicorniae TaxID=2933270 RepID=A0ABT0GIJ2_9GAMM|nr:Holliday junction resolvase RuvX [Lysobacter sp. CAU 1642]MCK7594365.1 Holliday junction resolvase RuvX [Lysobacter sp. CAU 1642]
MSGQAGPALGFDVGSRWIGVAIGNRLTGSARPLCVIDREREDVWAVLARLLHEWRPSSLVVGDPLTLDGAEQEATLVARRFARQLEGRLGLPVSLVDERHSSREASEQFARARSRGAARRRDAAQIDAHAAAAILQRWLDAGAPSSPQEAPTP